MKTTVDPPLPLTDITSISCSSQQLIVKHYPAHAQKTTNYDSKDKINV